MDPGYQNLSVVPEFPEDRRSDSRLLCKCVQLEFGRLPVRCRIEGVLFAVYSQWSQQGEQATWGQAEDDRE